MRLLCLILFGSSLFGQSWYATGGTWTGRKAKVVDHRRVLSTQTNIPLLVKFDSDTDLAGHLRSDCHDFLVTLADGTKLDHELVSCDAAAGTVHAFVRIPSLSAASETPLLAYYGNASAADQQNVTGVWVSSTKMVLNFNNTPNDSTSNAINATVAAGSPTYTTDSPVGPALSCLGLTDRLTTASAPISTQMTLSFWMRADMRPTGNALIVPLVGNASGSGVFGFSWDGYSQWGQTMYFNFAGGTNPLWSGYSNLVPTIHRWYHIAMSWDGTTVRAYTDGGKAGTSTYSSIESFTGGLAICGDASNQTRAELANVKLENTGRSAAWIYTQYENQGHPDTFFRTGAAETNTGTAAIQYFDSTYSSIEASHPTLLQWSAKLCTTLSIDNGVGSQAELVAGSVQVSPAATTTYTLTCNGSITATKTITVLTGGVAYLRAGPPATTWLRTFITNGAGHAVLVTYEPHHLAHGDYVHISGAATTDAGNTHFHASNLNGFFCVGEPVDATSFTIKDLATCSTYIDPNDTALDDSSGTFVGRCTGVALCMGTGASYVGRVTPQNLAIGLRGSFDGTNGDRTRRLGTSTDNGLTSLTVTSNVATITTSYDPSALGAVVGNKITIWGTTSAALNYPKECTITSTGSSSYTCTTSGVTNGTYTHNDVCGPSGGDPHIIGGADNCVVVSLQASSSNPNWSIIETKSNLITSAASYKHIYDGGNVDEFFTSYAVDRFQECAIRAWVDRANQNIISCNIYIVENPERYIVNNFISPPDTNVIQYGERLAMGLANPYAVARTLGHLNSTDKSTFANKMLNDVWDPATQCTRQGVSAGTGTFTVTGSAPTWTVVGIGSLFTSELAVGDVVYYGSFTPTASGPDRTTLSYYVSAIADNTHMTLINGFGATVSGSSFTIQKKWANPMCGYIHELEYESAWLHVQPAQWGNSGGVNLAFDWHVFPHPYENTAGLIDAFNMMVGCTLAEDDSRGARYCSLGEIHNWDANFRTHTGIHGLNSNGTHYGFGNEVVGQAIADITMFSLAANLPRPSAGSSYYYNTALQFIYLTFPDSANTGTASCALGPCDVFNVYGASSAGDGTFIQNKGFDSRQSSSWMFEPNTPYSRYLRNYLDDKHSFDGGQSANVFPFNNSTVASVNYRTQPLQVKIAPNTAQRADCLNFSGWDVEWGCGALRSDGFISKTDFGNCPTPCTSRLGHQVLFMARSGKVGYDQPQIAALSIDALGTMVYEDSGLPPGNNDNGEGYSINATEHMTIPKIGSFPLSNLRWYEAPTDWVTAYFDRWGGADPIYGDTQSRYVYARSNFTKAYSPTYKGLYSEVADMKKAGTKHVVVRRWDLDATNSPFSSPPDISVGTFFTLNGELRDNSQLGNGTRYDEGSNTSCPGAGGCSSLNTNRIVATFGNGAGPDSFGPARNSGVITKWLCAPDVPCTITWDGSSYTGNRGHANRATSKTTGLGKFDVIEVYDVSDDHTTQSLTTTALNPDSNWTGVQTDDKVVMFARGGVTHSSLGFTSTHSGTAQYLIAGVTAGSVTVTVGGTPVTGSPFAVVDGDNTVYFESTAGAVSIGGGAPPASNGGVHSAGKAKYGGKVVIH